MNKAKYIIDLQLSIKSTNLTPSQSSLKHWAETTLSNFMPAAELTIRIVDNEEMQILNKTYRHKNSPTNVLSFPFESPIELELPLLGDLVIAQTVVEQEAIEQNKSLEAHWAHMVVHGCLHLLGYDHSDEQEALEMEALEIKILSELGFANPYE